MDSSKDLFPKWMSAQQIVKWTLVVVLARMTDPPPIDELDLEKMAAVYEALLTHYGNQGQALAHLTRYLEATLDGKPYDLPPGIEG